MEIQIRDMQPSDWDFIAQIYKQGIDTGNATFQQQIPEWEDWDKSHLKTCRLVAYNKNTIIGWAALTPVSGRCVYAGVAEVSVYVHEKFRGQKIGVKLLEALVAESEQNNLWTLQAGIFPENSSSIAIHEKTGFRIVGHREKIGKMNGVWRNTILMERRSKNIGID